MRRATVGTAADDGVKASVTGDDDTRAKLLAAAGPVFAAAGFDGATVREICRAAGVNVASIGYHFGDKMGLYLEVIRQVRSRRACEYPLPEDEHESSEQRLKRRIGLLLERMLREDDAESWETQLMMREMQRPTMAFAEMVREYFQPLFSQLLDILANLVPVGTSVGVCQRLAFSVVGQCLYYLVGRQTIRLVIPDAERKCNLGMEMLVEHITAVTLAAASNPRVTTLSHDGSQ